MAINGWVSHDWYSLIQTGLFAGGLFLVGVAILFEARARRVGNLIQLTEHHRTLWERMYSQPELARILDPAANLGSKPVTAEEEMFVIFLILHLGSTYFAMRSGFFQKMHGLRRDIENFFSLPVPHSVWMKVKMLQEERFVRFVESCFPDAELA